jgi:antitoxin component of RelBE/YafQ-DinJ toxin-antitoxin module
MHRQASRCTRENVDSDFERFRVDPAVRDRAAHVCIELGHELSDILRAVVARIADDGVIPFALPPKSAEARSFMSQDPRLWSGLQAQVEAQLALDLLGRFIADCSIALEAQTDAAADSARTEQLTQQRDHARRLRQQLDVTDRSAVQAVLRSYAGSAGGHRR